MKHALQLRYLDLFYMIDYVIKNSKNFEDERKPSFEYCDETDKLNGKLKYFNIDCVIFSYKNKHGEL